MEYKKTVLLSILSILIVLVSLNIGIFWDNVLFASKIGGFLFENGALKWHLIPVEIDAGHPPFLATLLTFGWTLFGKSLSVSHWIMLPFIFGLLWQIDSFVTFFVKKKSLQIGAFLLVIADPTLLSQLLLVSPEVIQLFFFFIALNGLLRNHLFLKIIGLSFLGIVSYRGMMLCGGIFIIDFLIHVLIRKKGVRSFFAKRIIWTYLVAATPAIMYLIWRLVTKGWISSHPLENWGNAWGFSTFKEFFSNLLRNILVLGQRFTDFGRIIPILFILTTIFIKRKSIEWKQINLLLIIFFFSTIIIYITSLLIMNPMGHRYYIPSYLCLGLISFVLINKYKIKKIIYAGLLSSLLLGNTIVYSDSFSQGWDASLAHLPYWDLRKNAIEYMDDKQIDISKTASFFPNYTSIDNVDLNGDIRSFIGFSGIETYVFYSNVYNLSDEHLKILSQEYHIIKSFEKCNVRIELMQKNN